MAYNPSANPYGPQGLANRAPIAGPAYPAGPSYAGPSYAAQDAYGEAGEYDAQRSAYDANLQEQASIYTPDAARKSNYANPAGNGKGRKTVLRKGGGTVWEDQSLTEASRVFGLFGWVALLTSNAPFFSGTQVRCFFCLCGRGGPRADE